MKRQYHYILKLLCYRAMENKGVYYAVECNSKLSSKTAITTPS